MGSPLSELDLALLTRLAGLPPEISQNYWPAVGVHPTQIQRHGEIAPLSLMAPTNGHQLASYCQAAGLPSYWPPSVAINVTTCNTQGTGTVPRPLYVPVESGSTSSCSQMYGQYITPQSTNTSTLPPHGSGIFVPPHTSSFSALPSGFPPMMNPADTPASKPLDDVPKKEPVPLKYPVKYPKEVTDNYLPVLRHRCGYRMILAAHIMKNIVPFHALDALSMSIRSRCGPNCRECRLPEQTTPDRGQQDAEKGQQDTERGQQGAERGQQGAETGQQDAERAQQDDEESDDEESDDEESDDAVPVPENVEKGDKATHVPQETEGVKAVPATEEVLKNHAYKICQISHMVARRLRPALECVLKTVLHLGTTNYEEGLARIAKRKQREEEKRNRRSLQIQVPITLANGAPGRLYIFGPAYVMTEERQTQTVSFLFEATAKATPMDYEINPGEYKPVLKSHSKTTGDDKDGDADVWRKRLTEQLISEQEHMHEVLLWSESLTEELREYYFFQQRVLFEIAVFKRQSLSIAALQEKILQQCRQYEDQAEGDPQNEPQKQSYDEHMHMEEDSKYPTYDGQSSYYEREAPHPTLPVPPTLNPQIYRIEQEKAALQRHYQYQYHYQYQQALAAAHQQNLLANNQAIDLTARTGRIILRASRRLRAPGSKPGQKLESIASKLMNLGQQENGNK